MHVSVVARGRSREKRRENVVADTKEYVRLETQWRSLVI